MVRDAAGQSRLPECDESREPRSEDQTIGTHDARRLAQRELTVFTSGEVVQGAEHECRVEFAILERQSAGVADPGAHADGPRLIDVPRHGVEQLHLKAGGLQRPRVHTGAAADVQHTPGGDALEDDLLRARELDRALRRPGRQTRAFIEQLAVVAQDAGVYGFLRRHATYSARCSPVSVDLVATRSAGVPSNTTRPPS